MDVQTLFPALYGKSSKGVIKYWHIRVGHCREGAEIITEYGQLGGKIQTSVETVREGKNIGKANETTPLEQASAQALSKWKKQHDKNYSEKAPEFVDGTTEPEEDSSSIGGTKLLPMLAQKYNERKKYLVWPVWVQPKLNGVRCLVQRKGAKIFYWSRKAKQYKNFNLYMDQEFLSFMKDGEILDGEMYNHGEITFQELISLIKDEKTPDLEALKQYVKFHCYDRVEDLGFAERYIHWRKNIPNGVNYIRVVKTIAVDTEQILKEWHGEFVAQEYEGTIIRSGDHTPYRLQYRDNQLQKYKDFIDEEFEIVGCSQGKGKDEGSAIFHCQSNSKTGGSYGDGTFDSRCKGTYVMRREQWKNRKMYIGKKLTVRYQSLSDDGIPLVNVGIAVRDYE